MEAEELASPLAHASQPAGDLSIVAIQEPDGVVLDVADVEILLRLVRRERHAAGRAAIGIVALRARRRHRERLHELALARGDVDAFGRSVRRVNESVIRNVQRQVAAELLRRLAGGEFTVGGIGRDVRQLVPVRAPSALEGEGVHVEHHHASAEIVVRDIHLVVRFVDANLLDAADDHRRRRRVLLAERVACRRLRRGITAVAPASAAAASCCSRRGRQEARDRSLAADARRVLRHLRGTELAAVLELRAVRDLANQLAGLRVVLADGVLSEIGEALAVDVHPVPLRRVERSEHGAVLRDMDHRRWPRAAIGGAGLRLELEVRQIVRPVVHPDRVVIRRDREAGDAAHLPFAGQLLRPARVVDVARYGALRAEPDVQTHGADRDGKCKELLHRGVAPRKGFMPRPS